MTDTELLNMAAKACGHWDSVFNCPSSSAVSMGDPLESNADAFKLAVQFQLFGNIEEGYGDPYEATRRAIVRAVAKIGKEVK